MTAKIQTIWQNLVGRDVRDMEEIPFPATMPTQQAQVESVEIAPNDPIAIYFQSNPGLVEVDKLNLDSPALTALKAADVKIAIPLVSQG